MRVSFEISDKDISHFRDCMNKAREAVRDAEDEEIIEAAEGLFEEIRGAKAPQFVRQRLHRLEAMVNMVGQHPGYRLPGRRHHDRTRVP
jgi:hypothetical protein